MKIPPEHPNEKERLEILKSLEILDSSMEETYSELTHLAAKVCDAPISLLSLVDEQRQWFKARHGLEARETPREVSFCSHAILEDELFEIEDSRKDERFYDNPLVTEEPKVVFYAGTPLRVGDKNLPVGTLCVIDHESRTLNDFQRKTLLTLGRQIATHLNLRYQLKLTQKLMEERDEILRQKNRFISHMNHELRTPLNSIIGLSRHLKELPELPIKIKQSVDIIHKSGRHLLSSISHVLNMNRLHQNGFKIQEEEFNLIFFLSELGDRFSRQARKKGLTFQKPANSDLPRYIRSDPKALQQVLVNLVDNAIKFTHCGSVALKVSVLKKDKDLVLHLEVNDSGQGIKAEDLDRLMKPFEQGRDPTGGVGLGLSISGNLLKALGSELKVNSVVGEGSSFCFDLPISIVDPEKGPSRNEASHDTPRVQRLSPMEHGRKVLVVDDFEGTRVYCQVVLSNRGFEVATVETGEEAVRYFEQYRPDIIIMDIALPDISGIEAASRIQKMCHPQRAQIIACTASLPDESGEALGPMDPFVATLRKPFRIEDLLNTLIENVGVRFEEDEASSPKDEAMGPASLAEWVLSLGNERASAWLEVMTIQDIETFKVLVEQDPLTGPLKTLCEEAISGRNLIFMIDVATELKKRLS